MLNRICENIKKIVSRHRLFLFALTISILTYLVFFGQFLKPDYYFWGEFGSPRSDAQIKYVPAKAYLYDKIINEHTFPFWTEKMYSGFPIYADLESAYLHPINVASILAFGPRTSYEVMHILMYLIGSLSFYFFLKRKGIGILGFAAANAIFYFNTFFINHQIHFGMILSLYLIPTAILLADLFIEKRQLRYIFLQSLVLANAVLWGHIQSTVIIGLGIFVYMLIFSFKKMRFSTFLFYFLALGLFVFIETLPQLIPTFELFFQSKRGTGLDYLKGSLSPRMTMFTFIPYLLGGQENFLGIELSEEFTYTEIYFYLGISSVLLSVMAFLFFKKSKNIFLAFVYIWIFLLLGFLASNKIFPNETPVLNLFRNWGRAVVLAGFGVAFLAGLFIEKIREISYKNIKIGLLFVASPFIYVWIMILMKGSKYASKKINFYASLEYIKNYPYFNILIIIVSVLIGIFLILFVVKKLSPRTHKLILLPAKIIIVGIIFFDLIYFSKDVMSLRLENISNYKIGSAPEELENKRIILKSKNAIGIESLYYNNWSPFGCSQLEEKNYLDHYSKFGIKIIGNINSAGVEVLPENYQNFKDSGIVAIANKKGITYLNNNKLDILKSDLEGDYIEKKEGKIVMQINNPSDTMVSTYLKYNPYWRVKVDGQKVDIAKNGIFFDFPLSQGNHLVEIKYIPKPFFVGLFASLILTIILISLYYFFRKPLYGKILR